MNSRHTPLVCQASVSIKSLLADSNSSNVSNASEVELVPWDPINDDFVPGAPAPAPAAAPMAAPAAAPLRPTSTSSWWFLSPRTSAPAS